MIEPAVAAGLSAQRISLGYETIRQKFLVLYRSIIDLVCDVMKDEALNLNPAVGRFALGCKRLME